MAGIDANTELMLHMNGLDGSTVFVEDSPQVHPVTPSGSVELDTAEKVFGTASALFAGGNLEVGDASDFAFLHGADGSSNYKLTIDFRFKRASTGDTGKQTFLSTVTTRSGSLAIRGIQLYTRSTREFSFYVDNGGAGGSDFVYNITTTGNVIPDDTNWHYFKMTLDHTLSSNNVKFYLDGVLVAQGTKSAGSVTSSNSDHPLWVGNGSSSLNEPFDGWMDELRIQRGVVDDSLTIPSEEYSAATLPSQVLALSATAAGQTQIDLSWTEPTETGSGITGYKIERDSGSGFSTIVADTGTSATTYSDTGLDRNINYIYRVSAINADGEGPASDTANDTTDIGVPYAPTGLSALTDGFDTIDLSWTAPTNNGGAAITGYQIERESPTGGGWSVIVADTGGVGTTYSDTGLTFATEYNYRVSAINSEGVGDASNEASDNTDSLIDDNTTFLCHFNGNDGDTTALDVSKNAIPMTFQGTAELSTDKVEEGFGPTSLKSIDNSFNRVLVDPHADHPGGAEWTIEYKFCPTTKLTGLNPRHYTNSDGVNFIFIERELDGSPTTETIHVSLSGTSYRITGGFTFNNGTWYHIAVVRSADNRLRIFVNGQLQVTHTGVVNVSPGGSVELTGRAASNSSEDGYFDEIRFSNIARYTANFTPPSTPFGSLGSPSNLVATVVGSDQINLGWTKPTDDAGSILGYKIERESPVGGGWVTIVEDTGDDSLTYSDTGLSPTTEYNYRVSAINIHGSGSTSNEASATTLSQLIVPIEFGVAPDVVEVLIDFTLNIGVTPDEVNIQIGVE